MSKVHRLKAGLLLLFVFAGNVVPAALAAIPAPPRTCCLRMAHKCRSAGDSKSSEPAFRDTSCCRRDGGRVLATSRSLAALPQIAGIFLQSGETTMRMAHTNHPAAEPSVSQSPRAPPAC